MFLFSFIFYVAEDSQSPTDKTEKGTKGKLSAVLFSSINMATFDAHDKEMFLISLV